MIRVGENVTTKDEFSLIKMHIIMECNSSLNHNIKNEFFQEHALMCRDFTKFLMHFT